jgi:hypothetical protein
MSRADDRRRAPLFVGLPLSALLLVTGPAVVPEAAGQTPGSLVRGDGERVEMSTPSGTVIGTRIGTPHATLVTHASPWATIVTHGAAAAPRDEWVSLSIDVTPESGEHIYAQGAVGYQPVKLTVTTPRGMRLRGAARYSKPELYNFKALNEIVPVYSETFRVTQDVQLQAMPADRSQPLVFEGTLDYQACSESLCFETVTVPVSWSVALNAPGRQTTRKPRP